MGDTIKKRGWYKSILTKEKPNIAFQPRFENILRFPRDFGADLCNVRL
ncbi:hypothetical protein M3576_05200 [Weizmannia ginsengihumi]|nr:hypothetical protein [Heyndrickxia ginsengihumi]